MDHKMTKMELLGEFLAGLGVFLIPILLMLFIGHAFGLE